MVINIDNIFTQLVESGASDSYFTVGMPPLFRFGAVIEAQNGEKFTQEDIENILKKLIPEHAVVEFENTFEYNTAIVCKGERFRLNAFRQRKQTALVFRRIRSDIPNLKQLGLPPVYGDLILEKRGLILVTGSTGAGKTTSLASMLEHRNMHGAGHVVTIEDPIEFIHENNKCIFSQRDVGVDTYSFGVALKNALRQSPDVIVIGEIRDRETMEHAITFAETGHLCLATLHASSSNQAIERITNLFPEDKHKHVLLNLSLNLKAVLTQRLIQNVSGERSIALEIMLNKGIIKELIAEGRISEIREHIEKGTNLGMQAFDQSLLELYKNGVVSEEIVLKESDHPGNLKLAMKQHEMTKGTASSAAPVKQASNSNTTF